MNRDEGIRRAGVEDDRNEVDGASQDACLVVVRWFKPEQLVFLNGKGTCLIPRMINYLLRRIVDDHLCRREDDLNLLRDRDVF